MIVTDDCCVILTTARFEDLPFLRQPREPMTQT
jgi:hypothetical protein